MSNFNPYGTDHPSFLQQIFQMTLTFVLTAGFWYLIATNVDPFASGPLRGPPFFVALCLGGLWLANLISKVISAIVLDSLPKRKRPK